MSCTPGATCANDCMPRRETNRTDRKAEVGKSLTVDRPTKHIIEVLSSAGVISPFHSLTLCWGTVRAKTANKRRKLVKWPDFDSYPANLLDSLSLPNGYNLRGSHQCPFGLVPLAPLAPNSPTFALRRRPKCPTVGRCSHQRIRWNYIVRHRP